MKNDNGDIVPQGTYKIEQDMNTGVAYYKNLETGKKHLQIQMPIAPIEAPDVKPIAPVNPIRLY
jgi:hypothetical protein